MKVIKAVPTVFVPSRALEWHCALTMLAVAVILALPGSTFSLSVTWAPMEEIMSEAAWAVTAGVVSVVRAGALVINGHWRRSPGLRTVTAILSGGLWAWLAGLFYQPQLGALPIALGMCAVLAASEIRSAARAARDGEIARQVRAMLDAAPPAPLPWEPAP